MEGETGVEGILAEARGSGPDMSGSGVEGGSGMTRGGRWGDSLIIVVGWW